MSNFCFSNSSALTLRIIWLLFVQWIQSWKARFCKSLSWNFSAQNPLIRFSWSTCFQGSSPNLSFNLSSLKALAFLFNNLNLSASCFIFDWYCFSCLISFFLSFRFLILSSSSFWILFGRSLDYIRFDLKTNKLAFPKPCIFGHSKPITRFWMLHLKCFVLNTLCSKTKHLRHSVRNFVQGYEWLQILGFTLNFLISKQSIIKEQCGIFRLVHEWKIASKWDFLFPNTPNYNYEVSRQISHWRSA